MLESLRTLRKSFHAKFNKTLAIKRIVLSDDFELAYTNADVPTKRLILQSIEREDRQTLKSIIKKEVSKLTPFHKMTVAKLRSIGKNLGISEYYKLNKIFLIREIEYVIKRLKKSGKRGTLQPEEANADAENLDGCR